MGAQKNAPKKVIVTLLPYIYHTKTKWNIVYEYLKTKIFSRDTNILPQMNWTSNIFGQSAKNIGGFWVSLNYPILNFKNTACPKNVWMRHWLVISITYFRKLTISLFHFGNLNSISEVGRRLFNPSRPVPRQRGEINSTFYFLTSLQCLKRFYEEMPSKNLLWHHKEVWK